MNTTAFARLIALGAVLALIPATAELGAQSPATGTREVPVESFIFDLKNPDPVRRREAVVQLGANRIQRAVPDLIGLAADPDASVRRALVITLNELADIRVLPGLVTLSADAERDIRERAIEGMTALYLPRESGLVVTLNRVANFFNPWSDEWGEIVVEPDLKVEAAAITALIGRLQDSDDGIRAKAARSLGILRGQSAIQPLMTVLRDDRSDTARFEAVRALRKMGDTEMGKELPPLIVINAPRVRNEVVLTLGRLRISESVPELTRLFEKELAAPAREMDRVFAAQLIDALAFIAASESKPIFERLRLHADAEIRMHAMEGLARLGGNASPAEVTLMAGDRLAEKDLRVRLAQDFALFRMGRSEHLSPVVEALGSRRTNDRARIYLLELTPAELGDLYGHTANPDPNVLEGIAEVLGLIGNEGSLPTLRDLSRDTRGQIAPLANQAIRRIQTRTGVSTEA